MLLRIKTEFSFQACKFFGTQLGTVNLAGVHLCWRGPTNDCAQSDEGWLVRVGLGCLDGLIQGGNVLLVWIGAPTNLKSLPAVGAVAGCNIFGEGDVRVVLD